MDTEYKHMHTSKYCAVLKEGSGIHCIMGKPEGYYTTQNESITERQIVYNSHEVLVSGQKSQRKCNVVSGM